jgi:hypothetical protein
MPKAYCPTCKKTLTFMLAIRNECPFCTLPSKLIPVEEKPTSPKTCKLCGKPLTVKSTGRKPLFCSLAHRVKFHRATHSENP